MAYPIYQIGDRKFRLMKGMPGNYQQSVEIIRRPGVDSYGVRSFGLRGDPFRIQTVRNVRAIIEGASLMQYHYEPMIGDGNKQFIWGDFPYKLVGLEVAVLKVSLVELRRTIVTIGTPFLGNFRMVVDWELAMRDAGA